MLESISRGFKRAHRLLPHHFEASQLPENYSPLSPAQLSESFRQAYRDLGFCLPRVAAFAEVLAWEQKGWQKSPETTDALPNCPLTSAKKALLSQVGDLTKELRQIILSF